MDKTALRRLMVSRRAALPFVVSDDLSARIAKLLVGVIDFSAIRTVHCYRSNADRREVDTDRMIAAICESYPDIIVTLADDSRTAPFADGLFDLIIVPVVAFDAGCNRLGLGAGWYDTFLARQPKAITVGLAYDMQLVQDVPVDAMDVALDMIVTESRVFTRSSGRP